ncbi:pirin family protein [Alicyclobacillus hesperidum]|uniref:pirin family protein n=1 Tax=Alicyclobacillus hesperidum TaxID=89784 RepID=UPI0005915AD6|nr:pirin family protein [Alicyclobacillus hesperidum]
MWTNIGCGERVDLNEGLWLSRLLPASDGSVPPLDPLLLIDDIQMNRYGFPSHVHSGFEKLTLTLEGRVRHTDETGRDEILSAGDVHYLFAGTGFVHAELPVSQCRVIQIWFNIPFNTRDYSGFAKTYRRPLYLTHKTDWGSLLEIAGPSAPIQLVCAASVSIWEMKPRAMAEPSCQGMGLAYLLHGEVSTPQGVARSGQCLTVGSAHSRSGKIHAGDEGCVFLWVTGQPLKEPVSMLGGHVIKIT